jgi:glucose-6-phosphate 1-epimerase
MPWEFVEAKIVAGRACAVFCLRDTRESRALWPYAFLAELSVSISANQLEVSLAVTNTGPEPFSFTGALHTYLSVADITATQVKGLAGLRYRDTAAGGVEKQDTSPQVGFTGEVDRTYFNAPAEAQVVEPGRTTLVRKDGFMDTVVWNPAREKCALEADMEPEDYRRFVCVEAAAVGQPIRLWPGERWMGTQALIA